MVADKVDVISKKAAEDYVDEYNKIYGINYTILRYGSIYGPRSDDTNGVNKIIKNAILTGEINYMGNKNSVREYIHVFDAALASVGVLKNEFKNKCIIITGKKSVKVSKFLKILAKIMQLSGKISFQNSELKSGIWKKNMGELLSGKTLGIIGLGTIGKKLVEITSGLQLKYLAYDIIKDETFSEEHNV